MSSLWSERNAGVMLSDQPSSTSTLQTKYGLWDCVLELRLVSWELGWSVGITTGGVT